jgi:hypothetical protein
MNTVNKVGRPSVAPQQLERLTAKHFISKLRGTELFSKQFVGHIVIWMISAE